MSEISGLIDFLNRIELILMSRREKMFISFFPSLISILIRDTMPCKRGSFFEPFIETGTQLKGLSGHVGSRVQGPPSKTTQDR